MNERRTVTITLVIKGDREQALREVEQRLREWITMWFISDFDVTPPYSEGSLLWYGINVVGRHDHGPQSDYACEECRAGEGPTEKLALDACPACVSFGTRSERHTYTEGCVIAR